MPQITALRHLTLQYYGDEAAQVVKLLPKCTNLSSYTINSFYNVKNELKSMIEEFKIHQPKRLKPLKITV